MTDIRHRDDVSTGTVHVLAPTLEFLRQHAPFDRMTGPQLEFLAKHLRMGFYPKHALIAGPARAAAPVLYIIKHGCVCREISGDSHAIASGARELTAGDCFLCGALPAHRPAASTQRAAEDTFCFELERDDFEKLLVQSLVFRAFCRRQFGYPPDAAAHRAEV